MLNLELNKFVASFVADFTDMGVEKFDGEEVEYDRLREALQSLPFLTSRRLVVLRAPSANKEFVEKAEKLLAELPESTDVIIHEPKLDKRSAFYKLLKKSTDYKEFNELDDHGLVRWLGETAKNYEGAISQTDARYLIDRVGANQQLLANELQKLLSYDPNISKQSIDLLTEPSPQSTIFQLLDAAFAGNTKLMLRIYQQQRASKVEPQQIVAMLAWQLHILAIIKTAGERSDEQIASEAKINPFVVRKSRNITRSLTQAKLIELIDELTNLDLRLKTTAIDADDAVQAYLLNI